MDTTHQQHSDEDFEIVKPSLVLVERWRTAAAERDLHAVELNSDPELIAEFGSAEKLVRSTALIWPELLTGRPARVGFPVAVDPEAEFLTMIFGEHRYGFVLRTTDDGTRVWGVGCEGRFHMWPTFLVPGAEPS